MFKLESYITPLLMGYLDKYVKLRPEDFQLSLWGGDAVLYNLDLRLDVIEKAMQLPIIFQSGHIHELRLHVPWSRMGSEPVVVTINTIECILKLRDTDYKTKSSKAGSDSSVRKSSSSARLKAKRQEADDLPPGYLQSLMNKIMNNVNIIVNNLIVKFVEDDIVLSVNVKSAECYSVDREWNRDFVELSPPEFILQKIINVCDITVCLDKRDGSGRIDNYQDPVAYRCSVMSRLHMKYDSINAKVPSETKLNFYCERLDLSLTDTQLPMLIRLIEMCLALYYGTMDFKNSSDGSDVEAVQKSGDQALTHGDAGNPEQGAQPPGKENDQGWMQWAWSYVPQILPEDEEGDGMFPQERKKLQPAIFSLGLFSYKSTLTFKLTERIREKVHYGPRKVVFKPFLYLEVEGIALDVVIQGLFFFNCQFGITNLRVFPQGNCICGAPGDENTRHQVILAGGDSITSKTTGNYISQTLFDPQGAENLGIPVDRVLDWDHHLQVYTEQFGIQKYGFFWMDYLYAMAKPADNHSHGSSRSSISDVEEPVFVRENSMTRYVVGQCHLNVSSTTVHRVQKVLACAYAYDYEPYAKKQEEHVDEERPHPTEDQVTAMEEYVPTCSSHLTLLQPIISIVSAEHAQCDVAKKSYKSRSKAGTSGSKSPPSSSGSLSPLFGIQLATSRFDLQVTRAMYPRKLVRLVSKIAGPSSNLLHHCHTHTQIKLFGVHAGLTKVDVDGSRSPLLMLVSPTSGAMYTRKLLLPMYWNNAYLPKIEKVYELPQVSVSLTKANLLVILEILSSWQQATPCPADIGNNTLLEDVFPAEDTDGEPSRKLPGLHVTISGFEMKTCRNTMVTASSGTVSSIQTYVYLQDDSGKDTFSPVLYGSTNTENLHLTEWLRPGEHSAVSDDKNDCFTFTYQLPRTQKYAEAPAVMLVNVEGLACCMDPALIDWLSYSPRQKVPKTRGKKIEVDLELAKAASPLQANVSQISQASSGSLRQSESLTMTRSQTPRKTQEGEGQTETAPEEGKGWGGKLAAIFPLVRVVQVQVEVKKCCIFLTKSHLSLSEPGVNIPRSLQQLAGSGLLTDTLVVCLPQIKIQSAGLKPVSFLQEIPISHMEGSIVGDKLPWNVSLRNFSAYTVHGGQSNVPLRALQLVKPATLTCTVAVSFKCNPPTSDNISALGLCLHTDMHAVTASVSHEQVKLLLELSRKLLSFSSKVTMVIGEVNEKLFSGVKRPSQSSSTVKPSSPEATPRKPSRYESSTVENYDGIMTETSGDVTSLDTTLSREFEILDEGGAGGVRLSLWLQWTLPKCELRLYTTGQEDGKISLSLEENTISVDVQDVYAKVKVRVSSVNMQYSMRKGSGPWQKGLYGGILMNCHGDLSHDTHILSTKQWSGDKQRAGHSSLGVKHTREISHGFLNVTFTRALRKNVRKRFQKLNVEMPPLVESGANPGEYQFFFHKFVSEVCLSIAPCDFIINAPALQNILNEFAGSPSDERPEYSRGSTRVLSAPKSKSGPKSPHPLFTSSNLPIVYADVACVRVFLPGETTGAARETTADQSKTTIDHDMIMMQIKHINVSPQADNPLPRYPVKKELYQKAVQMGVTKQPGSAMMDRQYEIDVKGFSVATGTWCDFLQREKPSEVTAVSPGIQIPAVEWNGLHTLGREQDEIQLFPLVSGCDIKMVAAPAIVNVNPIGFGSIREETLICGYGLEVNIISDLDLHLSTSQFHLVEQICSDTVKNLTAKSKPETDAVDDLDSDSFKHKEARGRDSGLGSDISAVTLDKPRSRPLPQQPSSGSQNWVKVMTPFDVLLTAGRISGTLYSHKLLEAEVTVKAHREGEATLTSKSSKRDLEWRVDPALDSDDEPVYSSSRETTTNAPDLGFLNIHKDMFYESSAKVIPRGSMCVVPYFYLYISQPHTVVSCHQTSQKFEMSCYDILVKGAAENSLVQVGDGKMLADCSDFTSYWLETRAGQTHPVTGIPPCLYTLTMTNFLIEPVCINLKFERPVKANVSFLKFHQLSEFLDAILKSRSSGSSPTKKSDGKSPHRKRPKEEGSSLDILKHVKHLEIQTDQIVVAMETEACDPAPGVIGSVSSLRLEAEFQQNEKGQMDSVTTNAFIRDVLLKTRYYRSTAPFFGPTSVKIDATFSHCFHGNDSFPPQSVVTMATGLAMLTVSQEHVLCLKLIAEHLTQLLKTPGRGKESQTTSQQMPAVQENQSLDYFILNQSTDDLRSGGFQYILNPDSTGMMAGPGEIIFCDGDKDGNATMAWSYSQPRVISHIQLTPIPFDVEEGEEVEVKCCLQYWEVLIQQFVDYIELDISESETTVANLPEVSAGNARDLVVAQMWRVVIAKKDSRTLVIPSSLAVSMKVDSCFVPSLIPVLQLGITVEAVKLHLLNNLQCLGQGIPSKLKPFFLDSCVPASQEFAVVKLENILVAGSHISGRQARTLAQFSSQVLADVIEYKTLTMQRVVSPFEISGIVSLLPAVKPPTVDLDITCDPVTLKVGRGIIHSLECGARAWSQLSDTPSKEDQILFGHYILCNDTQHAIRFGQVGTDENLVLQPREMNPYSWRSHRMRQELHLCLDGRTWKWCEPFTVNKPGTIVKCVKSHDQSYTLVIRITQLSNVQHQIVISGQLLISNRLTRHVEIKVITKAPEIEQHRAIIGAGQAVPSYIVEPENVHAIKFRPWGVKTAWSKEVFITGEKMKENGRLKFTLQDQRSIHVWCRVFKQSFDSAVQILVVLCPLYIVRSHLPIPLYINLDTPKLNQHTQLESPGRGRDLQLQCAGGDVHHSLTFQFSASSDQTSSAVTLSTGLIDQLQHRAVSPLDIHALYTDWKTDVCWDWPYSQDVKDSAPVDMDITPDSTSPSHTLTSADSPNYPTIDLTVNLSELWPGCGTVLVDVTPWCLLTNHCDLDLVVQAIDSHIMDAPKHQTICPPKFEQGFQLGLRQKGEVTWSPVIPVSNQEVGAQRYRTDIGRTLYLDSYVNTMIATPGPGGVQVCFLTIQSSLRQQMRVITVRERYYLSNLTKLDLHVNIFTVPQWSSKVSVPMTTGHMVCSHTHCGRSDSNLFPVTYFPMIHTGTGLEDTGNKIEVSSDTIFVHYLSVRHDSMATRDNQSGQETQDCQWSYPSRLTASETVSRSTLCVLVADGDRTRCVPLCLSGHIKKGVSYFVLREDRAPACLIRNLCPFPLLFGQALMNLSLSGTTVQEETELVASLPTLPPGGGEIYYTPTFVNSSFSDISENRVLPKLHVAGKPIGEQENLDTLRPMIQWSTGIDVSAPMDMFLSIPDTTDTKIHVEHIAMVICVTIEPISKAEVSAREIRSRLKGKEKTVVVEAKEFERNDDEAKFVSEFKKEVKEKADSEKKPAVVKQPGFSQWRVTSGLLMKQLSIVVQDELSSPDTVGELLRVTLDDLFCTSYPASAAAECLNLSRTCFTVSVGDLQVDNQLHSQGSYDFPVVLVRQDFHQKSGDKSSSNMSLDEMNIFEKHAVLKLSSLLHLQVVIATTRRQTTVIDMLEVSTKPLSCYIDDAFIFRVLKEIEGFIPIPLSHPSPAPVSVLKLPSGVKIASHAVSSPVMLGHFCVQPFSILLSVHASLKLFIASDHTPLSFGKFEKQKLATTSHQLIRALAMHYVSGALFRAGAVVGSLEILGNPTGLVRSIGTGVADFFRMPYQGLTRGPGAFVVGISGGTASFVKNVSTGMLTSVTNFASSVSRNMDRLSMDNTHQVRQELTRRHRPDGITDGLKQGLTGLGISLLGAVAGLADQPIQNIVSSTQDAHGRSTASSLVTGMGKGIVGVLTKPIGGAAEFVSQTGQGLLQGTGLSTPPRPRCPVSGQAVADYGCGQVKFALKLLQAIPSNEILYSVDASHMDQTDTLVTMTLILTPEILFIISQEEDAQQQAFSIGELECGMKPGTPSVLTLTWRDSLSYTDQAPGPTSEDRVAAFIDGAVRFAVPRKGEVTPPLQLGPAQQELTGGQEEAIPDTNQTVPDNPLLQVAQEVPVRQFPIVIEGEQLSDTKTDSSSSVIGGVAMAAPQYDFLMNSTDMAAFMSIFNLTKRRLQGFGFSV